jgi:hypothetical protein
VISLSMFYLMIPLVAGIAAGFALRGKKGVDVSTLNVLLILVLIFSLGFSIGMNRELVNSLPRIGVTALVMASLAIVFSISFTALVGRRLKV